MITAEGLKKVNESLQTVNIKGKEYVQVTERVKAFRQLCPEGSLTTEIVHFGDGMILMKATITDEDGRVLATGHAMEKEESSYINKTSYVENCVPLTAMILTPDGWKYYHQLKEGQEVYGLDMETKQIVRTKLLKVNYVENQPLVRLSNSRIKMVCTPEHKWVVKTQHKDIYKTETKNLTSSEKIVQAIPQQGEEPSTLGRMLGWLMCDCNIDYNNGLPGTAYINQAKHVADVEELFGPGTKRKKYNDEWLDRYQWIIPAATTRKILGAFDMVTYKDLPRAMSRASIEDVAGCFQSMMLADGDKRGFRSTYPELIEAMQIMCVRLGLATTFVRDRMMEKSTRPIFTLGIKKGDGVWASELKREYLPPRDVWCPTTETGTWIMKQDTCVSITSNCETSAWGRALAAMNIGIDASMCSADELVNAISNQGKEDLATASEKKIFKALCDKYSQNPDDVLTKVGCKNHSKMTKDDYAKALVILKDIADSVNEK